MTTRLSTCRYNTGAKHGMVGRPVGMDLIALCCLCALIPFQSYAAQTEGKGSQPPAKVRKAPWHIPGATVRVPLDLNVERSRLRVDHFLAELEPIKSVNAVMRPALGRILPIRENAPFSVTVPVPSGSRYLPLRISAETYVAFYRFDDQEEQRAKIHRPPQRQDGANKNSKVVPVPAGAKEFTMLSEFEYQNAGFVVNLPAVAQTFCSIPSSIVSKSDLVVCNSKGKIVGSRIVSAEDGEQVSLLFDCSSGFEEKYYVYAAPKGKIVLPKWEPKSGVIRETRYLNYSRYKKNPQSLQEFKQMWAKSGHVAGRRSRLLIGDTTIGVPPLIKNRRGGRVFHDQQGAPLELTAYTAYITLEKKRKLTFFLNASEGGWLEIDGREICFAEPAGTEIWKKNDDWRNFIYKFNPFYKGSEPLLPEDRKVADQIRKRIGSRRDALLQEGVSLNAGVHTVCVYQYGHFGNHSIGLSWSMSDMHKFMYGFGADSRYGVNGLAFYGSGALEKQNGRILDIKWGGYGFPSLYDAILPAFDARNYWQTQVLNMRPADFFLREMHVECSPALPAETEEKVRYRWTFSGGAVLYGKRIIAPFLRNGLHAVRVDLVDAKGRSYLRTEQRIRIEPTVEWLQGGDRCQEEALAVITECFGKKLDKLAIDDLLNLHMHTVVHGEKWNNLKTMVEKAVAERIDELMEHRSTYEKVCHAKILMTHPCTKPEVARSLLESALADTAEDAPLQLQTILLLADLYANVFNEYDKALKILDLVGPENKHIQSFFCAPKNAQELAHAEQGRQKWVARLKNIASGRIPSEVKKSRGATVPENVIQAEIKEKLDARMKQIEEAHPLEIWRESPCSLECILGAHPAFTDKSFIPKTKENKRYTSNSDLSDAERARWHTGRWYDRCHEWSNEFIFTEQQTKKGIWMPVGRAEHPVAAVYCNGRFVADMRDMANGFAHIPGSFLNKPGTKNTITVHECPMQKRRVGFYKKFNFDDRTFQLVRLRVLCRAHRRTEALALLNEMGIDGDAPLELEDTMWIQDRRRRIDSLASRPSLSSLKEAGNIVGQMRAMYPVLLYRNYDYWLSLLKIHAARQAFVRAANLIDFFRDKELEDRDAVEFLFLAVRVYADQGNKDKAKEYFMILKKNYPYSTEMKDAEQILAELLLRDK